MKRTFFYDTEFIETPGSIELISIGVVGMDGETFYAVSSEADHSHANAFVVEHVLPQLPPRNDPAWMTRAEIARRLLLFLEPSEDDPIELWGYCSAYDHVVLYWLFSRLVPMSVRRQNMVAPPPGMPMYTRDVKQLCDSLGNPQLPKQSAGCHNALEDALWTKEAYLFLQDQKTGGYGKARPVPKEEVVAILKASLPQADAH